MYPNSTDRIERMREEIEAQVRSIQIEVYRGAYGGERPSDLIDLFEPGVQLKRLGYEIRNVPDLGAPVIQGVRHRIAGTIDCKQKIVSIAQRHFTMPTMRFTLAHELAHAVRHSDMQTMHRDVPLERAGIVRDQREIEANRFASAYLMPRKLLLERFAECYGVEEFILNDDTGFALCCTSTANLGRLYRSHRDLSLYIAAAQQFGGRRFRSLCEQFKVSTLAMAIRLEELRLVTPPSTGR